MEARFLRDVHGFPRCQVAPPHEAVGWFLEQDIQSDPRAAAGLLAEVEAVAAGRRAAWAGTGNAFHLAVTAAGAEIECLWDESVPVCRVELGDLREAIGGWLRLIGG